ncbi:hemicentin-1, partial [Paramuricea clavata]
MPMSEAIGTPTPSITLLNPKIVNITASSETLFDDIYLRCEVQGNPSPNVWWTKNGSYIQGYNIEFQDNNRTLIITRAVSDDVGTYYCHARNNVYYVNASFVLYLTYPPNTVIYTSNGYYVELYNGEKGVGIRCFGAGYPNVRVTWKRNGVEILEFSNSSLNTRVYQERLKLGLTSAESDLSFKEFYCNDTGIYTCETSRDGSDSVATKSIELKCNSSSSTQSTQSTRWPPTTFVPTPTPTVPWPPASLYVMPDNPTVVENSSIVLSCDCGCSIRPHWLKNNQLIRYDGSGSPYTLLANGSLRINASRWINTTGNYSCEIRTFFWRVRSKQVKLEIWYLDDCYVTGGQEIYRGQNISLTCHGNGVPYPTFRWYLGGQQLKTNSRIRIQGNQLNIFNATLNDDGKYKCGAFNQIGKVWDGVNVTVKDIPSIGISSSASKYTLEGKTIRFICQGEDRSFLPIQKIELVKDGVPFYQRLVKVQSSFWYYTTQWYSARQNDAGKYQCKVTIGAASRYSSPFYLIIG